MSPDAGRDWPDTQYFRQLPAGLVFVTHSIEESICLSDCIIVMTYRPGKIKKDAIVKIARSRDHSTAEFNELKKKLSLLAMGEQQLHNQEEI